MRRIEGLARRRASPSTTITAHIMNGERTAPGRRARRTIALALIVSCTAGVVAVRSSSPARAASQTHHVEVRSNFFSPRTINVSPGDTVVWTAVEAGHTVEADDGRFNFYPQRFLNRNEQVSFTFLIEETVAFYCRVHGAFGERGMSGKIVVGSGSPDRSPPPAPVEDHRFVPGGYSTIAAALTGIKPGGVVHLAPGVYRESIEIRVPDVTVTGDGAPGDVVIDGQGMRRTGVLLAARDTALARVTVRGHRVEGVAVRGVAHASVTEVIARDNGDYGALVADSTGTVVTRLRAEGHRVAGIAVKGCVECDAVVEDVVVERNLYGVLLDNAGSVAVRDSTIRGNATGVAVRSFGAADPAPSRGARITGNDITGNVAPIPNPSRTEFAVRSGVWLAGAWEAVVEGNRIESHDYGVLVAAMGVPLVNSRATSNVIASSTRADLAWDGVGAGMCFADNSGTAGEPTSRPPLAQTLYACDGVPRPGVPDPAVLADLARYATSP